VNGPIGAAALVLLGYLIGAVPVGLVVARLVGGFDIREVGSGRTGATNTLRTLGGRWAVLVFVLDLGKGVAAVLLTRWLYSAGAPGTPDWVAAAAGVAAVAGHVWSVFIGFTGGRGVATAAGALLALAPLALLLLAPVVAAVILLTRYVSLGSLTAVGLAVLLTALLAAAGWAPAAPIGFALAAGAIIAWSHRDNVARLRAGTERRIGEKARVGP
jgi:glycerol-3-phosphate acyltransferase PlsY